MDRISQVRQLKQTVGELLYRHGDVVLQSAATKLYSLLSRISRLDAVSDPADSISTLLVNGTALSPTDAARCVLDSARTSKFLRGIFAAVFAARRRFTTRPLEILYAGCGPFAPFAIALTTRFRSDEIKFTLLDVHSRSLALTRRIFHSLDAEAFVREYVQCDAASYVHQPRGPLHIVIVETMQRALEKEPQVAATLNLAPQVCRDGILIPQKIRVDACLSDLNKELLIPDCGREECGPSSERSALRRARINLGRIFELTGRESISLSELRRKDGFRDECLPPVVLEIPEGIHEKLKLTLLTTITVFGSVTLDESESGLTVPFILHDACVPACGARIGFRYYLGSRPGFKYEWNNSDSRSQALTAS